MTRDTFLGLEDRLPLTCTRGGTCCHGKSVFLNPWELACLAREKRCTSREFRDRFTIDGGLRLSFDENGLGKCSQYEPATGCTVHAGRPLACRLFPLGRRRDRDAVRYLYQGAAFPCIEGCPEVRGLPLLSVAEYLRGQGVAACEEAQDAYLELILDLAEGALVLLLDRGIAASGDRQTLRRWRMHGTMPDAERALAMPAGWLDLLTAPALDAPLDEPIAFVAEHRALLETQLQQALAASDDLSALREGCCLSMLLSLHLGRSNGMSPRELAEQWIAVAKQRGAK